MRVALALVVTELVAVAVFRGRVALVFVLLKPLALPGEVRRVLVEPLALTREVGRVLVVAPRLALPVAGAVGLVVPVIEDADQKTVSQLGAEAKTLVALANAKKLTPAQISGGTFTISNLGMFGVDQFTAIINPPEGAILAVGGMSREAVVVGDEILPRHRMRYTLSADHRIIDGALAAQFLQTLTRLIENPWTILA